MSDQQELHRRLASCLRDLARGFLDSAACAEGPDLKRKLARRAFELVQEAAALEPFADEGHLRPVTLSEITLTQKLPRSQSIALANDRTNTIRAAKPF
jgi:hypothetical protein